jgi:hypothetical protein
MESIEVDFQLDRASMCWRVIVPERISSKTLREMCTDALTVFTQRFSSLPDCEEKRIVDAALNNLAKGRVIQVVKTKQGLLI